MATEPNWVREELVSLGEYAALTLQFKKPKAGVTANQDVGSRTRLLEMARRRSVSFPRARSETRRTLYRLGDLLDYSAAHERGIEIGPVPPEWVVHRAVERAASAVHDAAEVDQARRFAIGSVAAHRGELPPGTVSSAVDHLLSAHLASPDSARIDAAVVYALEAGVEPGDVVEEIVREGGARSPVMATSTASGLAELLIALADPPPGATVYDPAAGEGALLLAAARLGRDLRLVGQERDSDAWDVAVARAYAHRVDIDFGPSPADSFAHEPDSSGFDAVIVDPPITDGDLWLRLALRTVRSGGRAVVALSEASLSSTEFASVNEAAQVEAIVITADRVRRDLSEGLAIWVLTRDRSDGITRVVDGRRAWEWAGSRKRVSRADAVAKAALASNPDPTGISHVDLTSQDLTSAVLDVNRLFPLDEDVSQKARQAKGLAVKLLGLIEEAPLVDHVTNEQKRSLQRLLRAMAQLSDEKR